MSVDIRSRVAGAIESAGIWLKKHRKQVLPKGTETRSRTITGTIYPGIYDRGEVTARFCQHCVLQKNCSIAETCFSDGRLQIYIEGSPDEVNGTTYSQRNCASMSRPVTI